MLGGPKRWLALGMGAALLVTLVRACVPATLTPTPGRTRFAPLGPSATVQPTATLTATPAPTATPIEVTAIPTPMPCTTVQPGDGWFSIAGRLGVHIWDLDVDTSSVPQVGQEVCWKTPPPPIPPGAKVVKVEDHSCLEIAAYYGVTLRELEAANRNRAHSDGKNDLLVLDWENRDENKQPQCIIQPDAEIVVPRPRLLTVAEAVQKYPCESDEGKECLSADASVEEVVQFVLYNEGASAEGEQFARDVMQVIVNRTNALLRRWGLDPAAMDREEYGRWMLHVIAMPADADETAPAFEAFFRAAEPVDPQSKTQTDLWDEAAALAQAALNGESVEPDDEITSNVQFYCSVRLKSPKPPIPFAWKIPASEDTRLASSLTDTYFFTTFPQSVVEWCQANRPDS